MSNVTGVQQARDRVLQMARQIEELSQSPSPPDAFFPEFLRLLVTSMGARAGAIWLVDSGRLALAHEHRVGLAGWCMGDALVARIPATSETLGGYTGEVRAGRPFARKLAGDRGEV